MRYIGFNLEVGGIFLECRFVEDEKSLIPVTESEDFFAAELSDSWSKYQIIAKEIFDDGSALYCLDDATGQIIRIDIELEDPVEFVNSSLDAFEKCLDALDAWDTDAGIEHLIAEVSLIDPAATEIGFWKSLFKHILFADDSSIFFELQRK